MFPTYIPYNGLLIYPKQPSGAPFFPFAHLRSGWDPRCCCIIQWSDLEGCLGWPSPSLNQKRQPKTKHKQKLVVKLRACTTCTWKIGGWEMISFSLLGRPSGRFLEGTSSSLHSRWNSCSENYFYLCHHCFWNMCTFPVDEWWVFVVESGSNITKPKPNTKTIWFRTDLAPFKYHLQSSCFRRRRPQVISLSMGGNHRTKHPSVSKRWLALEYQVPGKEKEEDLGIGNIMDLKNRR